MAYVNSIQYGNIDDLIRASGKKKKGKEEKRKREKLWQRF